MLKSFYEIHYGDAMIPETHKIQTLQTHKHSHVNDSSYAVSNFNSS